MPKKPKQYPPGVVREDCQKFLQILANYQRLLENAVFPDGNGPPKNLAPIRRLWKQLYKYGLQLISTGRAWRMCDWITEHPEWFPVRPIGFFPGAIQGTPELWPMYVEDLWGSSLIRFLFSPKLTGQLFGLADEDFGKLFENELVITNVKREVETLVAAANEQLSGSVANFDTRPLLTPLQQAVLDLIPIGTGKGITGEEIIRRISQEFSISQSTLTSHIIPKLKAYYGVENFRDGRGYYRTSLPPG